MPTTLIARFSNPGCIVGLDGLTINLHQQPDCSYVGHASLVSSFILSINVKVYSDGTGLNIWGGVVSGVTALGYFLDLSHPATIGALCSPFYSNFVFVPSQPVLSCFAPYGVQVSTV